jgi:hypothetical protein
MELKVGTAALVALILILNRLFDHDEKKKMGKLVEILNY